MGLRVLGFTGVASVVRVSRVMGVLQGFRLFIGQGFGFFRV